ncbi:MAG: hypothetical protein WC678_04785 [Parcubacteria group bacterium]|jgi:Tfp pilus assembly protein PilV
MSQKIFSKNKNYSGFSFIEGILAIFLISTGMLAVVSLMSGSLKESMGSRDQVIGVLLSQEGIELVRNLRDNNWANDRDTFDISSFPPNNCSNCRIDITSTAVLGNGSFTLKSRASDNVYNHTSGADTKFQREIQVEYDGVDKNTAKITSIVVWGSKSFADVSPLNTKCNSSNKCAYTQTTLTRWGGM